MYCKYFLPWYDYIYIYIMLYFKKYVISPKSDASFFFNENFFDHLTITRFVSMLSFEVLVLRFISK